MSEFRAYSNQKGVSQVTIMTVTVTTEEAVIVNEVYFQARHQASTENTSSQGFFKLNFTYFTHLMGVNTEIMHIA